MSILDDLSLTALDGTPFPVERLRGRAVLVVNVASRCGLTPQYAGLQALHDALAPRGLVVLGVPCNQFGAQEPGTPEQITSFCSLTYGVTFPLLAKQDVNGPDRSPLYARLVGSEAGGGADIGWNFEKFLLGADGTVRARFSPRVPPEDPGLRAAVEDALAEVA